MFDDRYFELKEEHIKLLTKAYVGWQDCEFGAPEIDPKRPYGNSYVYGDIAQILDIKHENKECEDYTNEQYEYMRKLHEETQMALQVILRTRSFEPGLYKSDWTGRKWEKIK